MPVSNSQQHNGTRRAAELNAVRIVAVILIGLSWFLYAEQSQLRKAMVAVVRSNEQLSTAITILAREAVAAETFGDYRAAVHADSARLMFRPMKGMTIDIQKPTATPSRTGGQKIGDANDPK